MNTQLTFLPADSHANHSLYQENNKDRQMLDTSILKCLEQYEKLNPSGLWQKMFVGLLHQNFLQSSKIYAHRWKLRGTGKMIAEVLLTKMEIILKLSFKI